MFRITDNIHTQTDTQHATRIDGMLCDGGDHDHRTSQSHRSSVIRDRMRASYLSTRSTLGSIDNLSSLGDDDIVRRYRRCVTLSFFFMSDLRARWC